MSSSSDIIDNLTRDQLNVALYIYIGQNIRDEGILEQDSNLEKMASDVQFLLEQGIVEKSHWYKLEVLRISYRFTVTVREKMEKKLQSKKPKLYSALQSIPDNILSFLVFEYLPAGLSFPVKKDWLFDWRDLLLKDNAIKKYKGALFKTLMDLGFCVRTNSYVSTRGGELRDAEYVINAEVRKFLEEITPHLQFPSSFRDLAMIHWLIHEAIAYKLKATVDVTIKDEVLAELGSQLDTIKNELDNLLDRLNSANVVHEIRRTPGFGTEITADRKTLLHFIKIDVQDQIVKPLLSGKDMGPKKEDKEKADFLRLVQTLIDKKFSLYKTAAQFGGKEIFKSLPYTERCVIDLTTPLPGEEGLRRFVSNLHQVLEESSTKETLKFREGDFTSLEEWLEIEIPSEVSLFYEDAKLFFRDLNRLRNFYSHSVDAKDVFEAGLIFSRLIGKYSPDEDDILRTEVILLQRSIRALQGLERALRMVWEKKMST